MILSHTCRIAVKAVFYIARNKSDMTNIKNLTSAIKENQHTTAKVLQLLVKAHLVSSNTGPRGGFFLTETQLKIPLSKIVTAVDGNGVFENCIVGLAECSAKHPCPLHKKFEPLRKDIVNLFENTLVTDLTSVPDTAIFF